MVRGFEVANSKLKTCDNRQEILKDLERENVIHLAMIWFSGQWGAVDVVKHLVSQGAYIHTYEDQALSNAARCGDMDIFQYLLEEGAILHANNNSPLSYALAGNQPHIVEFILSEGIDAIARPEQMVQTAVYNGNLDVVKMFFAKGFDVAPHLPRMIVSMCMKGHSDILKYFMETKRMTAPGMREYALRVASVSCHWNMMWYIAGEMGWTHAELLKRMPGQCVWMYKQWLSNLTAFVRGDLEEPKEIVESPYYEGNLFLIVYSYLT